jgi:hypothetical protein
MEFKQIQCSWPIIHLALGLGWAAALSTLAQQESAISLAPWQVAQMLIWAGWLPTIATSCWQVKRRHWKALLISDILSSGVVIAFAFTIYLPLFLFNIVWFLPFALLPRGCITELLSRTAQIHRLPTNRSVRRRVRRGNSPHQRW